MTTGGTQHNPLPTGSHTGISQTPVHEWFTLLARRRQDFSYHLPEANSSPRERPDSHAAGVFTARTRPI